MPCINPCENCNTNKFVMQMNLCLLPTTLSHGHQSEPCSLCECADLLNSYLFTLYCSFAFCNHIILQGIRKLFESIGNTLSAIQTILPVPNLQEDVFNTLNDFTTFFSGFDAFFISTGCRTPSVSIIKSISFWFVSR